MKNSHESGKSPDEYINTSVWVEAKYFDHRREEASPRTDDEIQTDMPLFTRTLAEKIVFNVIKIETFKEVKKLGKFKVPIQGGKDELEYERILTQVTFVGPDQKRRYADIVVVKSVYETEVTQSLVLDAMAERLALAIVIVEAKSKGVKDRGGGSSSGGAHSYQELLALTFSIPPEMLEMFGLNEQSENEQS